ncbi:methyltransferase domain-containing protein [Paenibacillus sp. CAU 1782]
MAIVQLKSTNPKFSFLIKKNPASGMQMRSVRKGLAYGWSTGEGSYGIYFKDADNEVSFKRDAGDSFEYLNVSRYNTPLFPLSAINEFFSVPLKAQHEQDLKGYRHSFYIPMIHIDRPHYIAFFANHLKNCSFTTQHQAHKSYSLLVETEESLHYLLHVVSVLCLFLSMQGNEAIDITDEVLEKYLRSLNIIDAPFYLRSLFARHFLFTRDRFRKYKAEAERSSRYVISLGYGGTAQQRRSYIAGQLSFDNPILDIGCGEGFYAIPFAAQMEHAYYAVDIDEERLELVKRKAQEKQADNIAAFHSLDHYLESANGEKVDVILTEVIEHMPLPEAGELLLAICREVPFSKLIVTTPNADFNPHYELGGFRHDDHKWELGEVAFREWFEDLVEGLPLSCQFVAIGDTVDGIATTQGVIVTRKEG